MNPRFTAAAQLITDLWREEFRKVMEAMADLRPELEPKPAEGAAPASADVLWWKQPFDLADGAMVWVGAEEAAWSNLGQQILTAAGIDSAAVQEVRSTFLEVLRQSLSSLGTALGGQLGREVTAKDGGEEEPNYGGAEEHRFKLAARDTELPDVHFWISAQLLEAMARRNSNEPRAEERPAERPEAPAAAEAAETAQASSTLDLLLDVEMPVSVSFGRTQIRLQDVLKLISGSIIELDRSISEPVQVIVNNCVIASGEVVVVDGNYGVRIHEIMSRRGRLEQSRRYMLPLNRQPANVGG